MAVLNFSHCDFENDILIGTPLYLETFQLMIVWNVNNTKMCSWIYHIGHNPSSPRLPFVYFLASHRSQRQQVPLDRNKPRDIQESLGLLISEKKRMQHRCVGSALEHLQQKMFEVAPYLECLFDTPSHPLHTTPSQSSGNSPEKSSLFCLSRLQQQEKKKHPINLQSE